MEKEILRKTAKGQRVVIEVTIAKYENRVMAARLIGYGPSAGSEGDPDGVGKFAVSQYVMGTAFGA